MGLNKTVIITLLMLTGCNLFGGNNDSISRTDRTAEASFSYEFDVINRNSIRIEAISGSTVITGVAGRNTVSITGVRTVGSESTEDAEEFLQELEVWVTESSSDILVQTVQPQDTGGRLATVDYEIILPEQWRSFVVQNNGTITIEDMREDLEVEMANGDIQLNRIAANTSVAVINGTVIGDIVLPPGGTMEHSIFNGEIKLSIPDTTSAEFAAQTDDGNVRLFGLELSDQSVSQQLVTGTLGDGNGTIALHVMEGDISVTGTQ